LRRPNQRGFTLIEMVVVLAIVGVLASLAVSSWRRARPRATFSGTSAEIQSLVHLARQQALSSGVNVAVMIFPGYARPGSEGTGRIIVIQDDTDPTQSLFAASAALKFGSYDPGVLAAPANGSVVTTLDLPKGIVVGPADGMGPDVLPFPYNGIITNLDCSFCSGAGATRRGAIVFDSRGRTTFRDENGAVAQPQGGSFTVTSQDLATISARVTSTLVITSPQGMLRTYLHG
jgi:prepilin-type N-terminal cleavage/methylation domain-containing protein